MRGFSVMEVLVALAVMATTLLTVTFVLLSIPEVLRVTRTHQEALTYAERALSREYARGADGYTRSASTTEHHDDIVINLSERYRGDQSSKYLYSVASWPSAGSKAHTLSIEGFITDYANASSYTCSPLLIGNWEQPLQYEMLPETGRFPALHAVAANRHQVLAAASTTPTINESSLFLFDTTGVSPAMIASHDRATSTTIGYTAITLSPSNAYAVSSPTCSTASPCASLDVFSLEHGLTLLASYALPATRSITYHNERLYVGLRSSPEGPEFLIFDVEHPTHPVQVGSMEVGASVNDVEVGNGYAYLATADNSIIGNRAVILTDGTEPREGMVFTKTGRPPGAGISQHLSLSGLDLYLGRSSPLYSKELYWFSQGDLIHPLEIGDTEGSIVGLVNHGFQLLALTKNELKRFDTGGSTPRELPGVTLTEESQYASALVCGGRALYVALNTSTSGTLLRLSGS